MDSTKPENLISYTNIEVDGNVLENIGDYKADGDISFNIGQDYTDVDGIVTFRGNSFRDTPSHGYADMTDFRLNKLWSADTGSLSSGSAVWTGSGWTGQPLMMKWPKEVKAHMNMTEKAKADDELVEVIYACMDGYVYFLDLRTGEKTRDPLYLGYTFKGAGALDPRGYPIMYVGAGYNSNEGTAKVFVVNLLDCSVMYTFGDNDEFSLRGSLSFFDGSALVDAETDTLIYPGENGILYLIRLNTKYDLNSGTLSIDPGRTVKWRYYGTRSCTTVTKEATTTINAGIRTLSGIKFLRREIIKLDAARITVVVSPIPIPLVADVVIASVGHIPSISTKVGFSLMIPLYKRSAGVFGFITDFPLSHTGMHIIRH